MDGFINLLKPPGMTSQNAVSDVRRLFQARHAGHLGTLDPGAAGVLPIALGKAAKLFDLLSEKEKTYLFEVLFGVSTDTLDLYGKPLEHADRSVTEDDVHRLLPGLTGSYLQIAPAFSALKIHGRRMYDMARSGEDVPQKSRPVTVSLLELITRTGPNRFLIRCTCSRGTYIRSICRDLGIGAGTPATMSFLLRTASGPFHLQDSVTIEELRALTEQNALDRAVLDIRDVLSFLRSVHLDGERKRPMLNGLPTWTEEEDGTVLVYAGGSFLGVGEIRSKELKLKVHLYEE